MKKCAFTLAEVLITLVIIGVIAALTIPTLMNNMKDEANIVALKKFYSETNQLLQTLAVEECGTPGNIGCFSSATTMERTIARRFKMSKECAHDVNKDCWAPIRSEFEGESGFIDDYDDYNNDYYSFVTLDGMSVFVNINSPSCTNVENADPESPMNKFCGAMKVDVNGFKPPNREGKDVFTFEITSNKAPLLYPYGGKDYMYWRTNGCQRGDDTYGASCTGRLIENGWKADYSDVVED